MGKLKMQVTCPHCGKQIQPTTKRVRKKALVAAFFLPVISWPFMGKATNKQFFCPECGVNLKPAE